MEDFEIIDQGGTQGNNYRQATLPNATATLVLGIISIVGCVFYGVPGLVCGIICMVLHSKDKKLYQREPNKYEQSFKTAKAGYICGIIGLSMSALYFLIVLILFGTLFANLPRIR